MTALLATIASEPSTNDQIREAATFASITLGILSAFASQRATVLGKQKEDLRPYNAPRLRRDFLIDLSLAIFGLVLLLAAVPLFVAAVDRLTPLLRTDTAFFSLFCLFYLGLAAVVAWVASMTVKRAEFLTRQTKRGLLSSLASPG